MGQHKCERDMKGLDRILDQLGLPRGTGEGVARLIEDHLADPGALVRLAAGPPRPIGELLVDAGRLDAAGLRGVLEEQAATGERFGEVLVRHGDLSEAERDIALEFQRHQREPVEGDASLRLGTILLAQGDVTLAQLDAALVRQRGSGRKLGEELVAAGDVDERRLAEVLSLQRKLVAVALAAALALAPVSASAGSGTPLTSQGQSHFVVKIPATVRMQSLYQAGHVTIDQGDVNRGYVDVASASRFELFANTPYDVQFATHATWFRSVKISGLPNELEFGAEGGRYFQPLKSKVERGARQLDYRFELDPGTVPGTYVWPLSLVVTAA
jgi:hypothetical protein